jgi:4-diphosphocytidyl-2-C-methyl-D-erythritol kinase
MILFPNGKINLGLHILRKNANGYHDIETVFYPVQVSDALEILAAENTEEVSFSSSGLSLSGPTSGNLCIKAYRLMKELFPGLPGIQLHLHKVIPMGAGLGGGSADGTSTLLALNRIFDLHLSDDVLSGLALRLGSDCPFFIHNKPLLAEGRGEVFSDIEVSLKGYELVLVFPRLHIPTPWAFSVVTPRRPEQTLRQILLLPPLQWKQNLVNDFEAPVGEAYPQIRFIREELYRMGAVYAALSGSGSTVFGLFNKGEVPVFTFDTSYEVLRSPCLF